MTHSSRSLTRRQFTLGAASLPLAAALGAAGTRRRAAAQDAPETIKLDYAYYNPSSLVLRRQGWLEEDLTADGVGVEWVLSAGSNKANEFLRSDAIDFGSTAGSAALLAKANGSPDPDGLHLLQAGVGSPCGCRRFGDHRRGRL